MQRGHYFAIVDEVDSILIDEARTPLIISGASVLVIENKYDQFKTAVESLVRAQEKLCARFLSEAEDLMKKLHPADGSAPAHPEELDTRKDAPPNSASTSIPNAAHKRARCNPKTPRSSPRACHIIASRG